MRIARISGIAALFVAAIAAAGCANTIRGVGRDTAATVDATQRAGQDVQRATR